ncbi:13933_t:CDS:1, partial [Gigaspora rosea]
MKGKAPRWFSKIEEVTLKSSDSRKLKEKYLLEVENRVSSQPQLEKLQADKRVKDWVIIKKKNLDRILLGRIDRKLKHKTLVDHWLEVQVENDSVRIERCKECQLNSKGKENDCQFIADRNEHVRAISGVFRKENSWHLTFPLSYYKSFSLVGTARVRNITEEVAEIVEINSYKLELIEKQGLGERISDLLKSLALKNIKEDR